MKLGSKIRKIRELRGYNQDFLASKLDISQRAYSKLERDQTKLDWERLVQIASILDIEPIDLVSFDDSLIFNNCSQSGKINTINNNITDELKSLYERHIKNLKEEVSFLRAQLNNKKLNIRFRT